MDARAGVVERVPEAREPAGHVRAREVGVRRRRAAVVGLEFLAADNSGVGADAGQHHPRGAGRVVVGVGDRVVDPFRQRRAGRVVGHRHLRRRRDSVVDRLVGDVVGDVERRVFAPGEERARAALGDEHVLDRVVEADLSVLKAAHRLEVAHHRLALADLERRHLQAQRIVGDVVVEAVAVEAVEGEERERHRAGDILGGR